LWKRIEDIQDCLLNDWISSILFQK